jgi:parallel beta-helix repeat protein
MMKAINAVGVALLMLAAGCGGGGAGAGTTVPPTTNPPTGTPPTSNPPTVTPPTVTPPTVTPPTVTPPSPVDPLTDASLADAPRFADAQATSPTVVYVTWKDATNNETSFTIERRSTGGAWKAIGSANANATLYKDSTVTANTSYEYQVTAVQANGNSSPSDIAATTTPADLNKINFVDFTNGNDNTGTGKEDKPWKTLQKAADNATAGITTLVRQSALPYSSSTNYAVMEIKNDVGTNNAWIKFKNFPGERPKIRVLRNNNHGIVIIDSSYVSIEGFEIQGHFYDMSFQEAKDEYGRAKASYDAAKAIYDLNQAATPVTDNRTIDQIDTYVIKSLVDSSGITFKSSSNSAPAKGHHAIIRNNTIYDFPGGGINSLSADYVTMEYNRVYNVGAYSPYGASGVNYYQSVNFGSDTTDYRQIVRGNIVSEVRNLFPCSCARYSKVTDGNGIILDKLGDFGYTGRTLITNNLVFNNGARGIHVFKSLNADVFNNTAVRNGTLPFPATESVQGINAAIEGEISAVDSRNLRFLNNIVIATSANPSYAFKSNWSPRVNGVVVQPMQTVTFDTNIIQGGARDVANNQNGVFIDGTANRTIDPLFAVGNTGINAYRLSASSPAINAAVIPSNVVHQSKDVFGAPRVRGGKADIGAIESF